MTDQYLLEALNELAAAIHSRNIRVGFYDNPRPFDGMLMNVVTEVSEAQEEWRRGRGMDENHWTITARPEDDIHNLLRVTKHDNLQVRNYDYDYTTPGTVPE